MGDPSPLLSLLELPYTIREVSDNEPEPQPSPQQRPMTRKEARISSYVWPTVYEPPTDDELDCDKSLVEPAPVKTPAAVGKSTLHRSLPKSADRLRGNTFFFCRRGRHQSQEPVGRHRGRGDPRSASFDPQDRGSSAPPLRRTDLRLMDQALPLAGPIGSGGGESYSLRDHGDRTD